MEIFGLATVNASFLSISDVSEVALPIYACVRFPAGKEWHNATLGCRVTQTTYMLRHALHDISSSTTTNTSAIKYYGLFLC